MKRIKTEKGSERVSEDIPKETEQALNKITKLAYEQQQKPLNIGVVNERKIVGCKDPMICLRGCSVKDQTCKCPIYGR